MPVVPTAVLTIAGGYTIQYNGSNAGRTRDGFKIVATNHNEDVHTDDYGDVHADGVNRGTSYMITLEYAEYTLIKAATLQQQGTEGLANMNVGVLASAQAKSLILTAVAGTTAAALDGTKVYTFPLALISDDVDFILANHARQGPIRFKLYPDSLGRCYVYA